MLPCSGEDTLRIIHLAEAVTLAAEQAAIRHAVRVTSPRLRGYLPLERRWDLRQALAEALLTANAEIENFEAWLVTCAKRWIADEVDREARDREIRSQLPPRRYRRGSNWHPSWYPPHPSAKELAPFACRGARIMHHDRQTAGTVNVEEDRLLARIAASRGTVPLTKIDREFLWDEVRAWCASRLRARFGRSWTPAPRELTPQELTTMVVGGRQLAPDEATWIRLLSLRSCPVTLALRSDTKPRDVFDQAYETVKKAFQRAKLQKSSSVSPDGAFAGGLPSQAQRF